MKFYHSENVCDSNQPLRSAAEGGLKEAHRHSRSFYECGATAQIALMNNGVLQSSEEKTGYDADDDAADKSGYDEHGKVIDHGISEHQDRK